jgi:hypothetical protein
MRAQYERYGWLVAMVLTVWVWGGLELVAAQTKPAGTMTWALHFSIAPTFFDPAEASGIATPFKFLQRAGKRLRSIQVPAFQCCEQELSFFFERALRMIWRRWRAST